MEEQKENIKPPRKKKKLRRWIRVLTYMFLLFVVVDIALIFYATPLLKKYIKQTVNEKTEGLFSVEFSKISFEISTRRISLDNFNLIADTAVYNKFIKNGKARAALYNISCGSVELKGLDVRKLFNDRVLSVKNLSIIDPIVELKKLPTREQKQDKSRDFVHQDLYPAISKYFKEVLVRKINLENGKFLLRLKRNKDASSTHIGYISVVLEDFLLNKEQFLKKNKLFYADDLKIQISEYRANLNDNIHIVYADTLKISTKSSTLKILNVGIEPISKKPEFLNSIKQNYLQLKTPLIEVKGFNISQLYFAHDIVINEINIDKPNIDLVKKLKTTKINNQLYTQEKRFDLTVILSKNLKSIKIDSLKINDAQLRYYLKNWRNEPLYDAKNFNICLDKFDLNKQTHKDLSKILYSDGLRISIDKIAGKSSNYVHRFVAKNIYASTKEKLFRAKAISVKPCCKSDKQTNVDVYIPALSLRGTNYHDLLYKKILRIYSVNIASSRFNVNLKKTNEADSLDNKKRKPKLKKIFFKNMIIRNLNIADSKFKIEKPVTDSTTQNFSGNIALKLHACMINNKILANKQSKLLAVETFDVKLNDYQQDLKDLQHILKANSLHISNKDSLVSVSEFKLYKKDFKDTTQWLNSDKIYNINIQKAYLQGVDIYRVVGKNELVANSIYATTPRIHLYKNIYKKAPAEKPKTTKLDSLSTFRDLLGNYLKVVNVKKLKIKNAELKFADFDSLETKKSTLQTKICLDIKTLNFVDSLGIKNNLSYAENIKLRLDDFVLRPFPQKYKLELKNAEFSSKDSVLTAKVVRFFPDSNYIRKLANTNFIVFYTSLIKSKSLNIRELIDSNIINLGKLSMDDPVFLLNKKQNGEAAKNKTKRKKKRKTKLKRLIAESINIKNGAFAINHNRNGKEELITSTTFDIILNNLDIDSIKLSNPKTLISNLDFSLDLHKSYFKPFGKKNLFSIEELNFDNKIRELNAQNISLKMEANDINKQMLVKKVHVNKLRLLDFNLGEFAVDKNLIIRDLLIHKPDLTVFRYKSQLRHKKNDITKLNLYEKIRKSLNSINISHVESDSIKLRLTTHDGFDIKKQIYDDMYANISGLIIDKQHQNDGRLFSANDITFHLKNYNIDLSNNLYALHIGDLGFSTGRQTIFANNMSINPNTTRFKYIGKRPKEFTINYLRTKTIEANNVNFKELISKGNFFAKNILIDSLQYQNYKNKKYPPELVEKEALPLNLIWNSKRMIDIDSIKISNSYIGHDIMLKNAKKEGFLDFTNVNASISNLTNVPTEIEMNKYTQLDATANFMDNALLQASFTFDITSNIGEYMYNGNLQDFNMKLLNPFVENTYFVSIKSGMVDNLDFNITSNSDYSVGYVKMKYHDLKLDLINKKTSDSLKVEKRGLFSMVANSVVRNKNRRLKQSYKVYYKRNIYKSAVNYWVLSLLSGVKNSLGFKSKELKSQLKDERSYERIANKNRRKAKKHKKNSS